jgi:hypothetical protein
MNRFAFCVGALTAAMLLAAAPSFAEDAAPVGYGGSRVRLQPIMSPYRTPSGIQYQVITVQLVLDVGVNEKPACFMIPIVHEKFLMYLYKTMPQPEDLIGQRKDVFEKALLDIATATTDRGFYAGVQVVDEASLMPRGDSKKAGDKDKKDDKKGEPKEAKKATTADSKALDPKATLTSSDPMDLDPKSKTLSTQCTK